jgi:H2-forming N5,N10-methylenetetrahydromethanopterin dehydrogenase-like enzyme
MTNEQIQESAQHMAQLIIASGANTSDLEAAILAQMTKNIAFNDKYDQDEAFARKYNQEVLKTL